MSRRKRSPRAAKVPSKLRPRRPEVAFMQAGHAGWVPAEHFHIAEDNRLTVEADGPVFGIPAQGLIETHYTDKGLTAKLPADVRLNTTHATAAELAREEAPTLLPVVRIVRA